MAREIRQRDSKTVIILMASRYAPYDQAKGKDAGADDFMDKPFDTQQAIDKVKRAILTRESAPSSPAIAAGTGTGTGAPAAAATPRPAPQAPAQAPRAPGAGTPAPVLPITAKPTQGSMGQRSGTLVFGQPVQGGNTPVVTGFPVPAPVPAAPPAPPAPAFTPAVATPPAAATAPAAPTPHPGSRRAGPRKPRRGPCPHPRPPCGHGQHQRRDQRALLCAPGRAGAHCRAGPGRRRALPRGRREGRLGSRPPARRIDDQGRDRAAHQRRLTLVINGACHERHADTHAGQRRARAD